MFILTIGDRDSQTDPRLLSCSLPFVTFPPGMRLPVGPRPGWELEDNDDATTEDVPPLPFKSVADRCAYLLAPVRARHSKLYNLS